MSNEQASTDDPGQTQQAATATRRRRAGLVRILASMLYDLLPIAGFWLLTSLILVFARGSAVTGALYQTLLFLELFGYFAFSWVRRGQTLGMVAWKLRLEPVPITFTQAALRLLGAMLGALAFGLGYFWILIDRDQRSWADILSGSRIDYDPQLGGSWWSGS
ncbi:MAG: RDD family protein [Pseudomonadota bacterium]